MFPHLIGRKGRGAAVVVGSGGGDSDGGFVEPPVVTTTASGNTTVNGKVKPGSFGKFVYPLATIAAGRQYTFRYTPQFAQLAQQGKLAMVGFGLKNGNDFHLAGLRGNGTTGLNKYKVNGTPPNGWNKDSGHTTSDGGASANGTQAGPNYIRLIVSSDGATYKFATSPDNATWTDEYTGQTPTPFSNVSGVATFGIALWFNNADAGPFSILIDQFADVAAPITDPYWTSVKLLLGFEGADGATGSPGMTDESSSARGTASMLGNAQIDTAVALIGTSSLLLDGSGDGITFPDSVDWKLASSNSDQFTVECFVRTATTTPTNMVIIGQSGGAGATNFYFWNTSAGNGELSFWGSSGGSSFDWSVNPTTSGLTWATGTRYHLACDKDATGKVRIYRNGVMVASATPTNSALSDVTSPPLYIGNDLAGRSWNGWIDEVRITKGVARYASDAGFTAPTVAFPRA